MTDLSLRRMLAFAVDTLLLSCVLVTVSLMATLFAVELDARWDSVMILLLALYFGLAEGLADGQSVGKKLVGIWVRSRIHGRPSLYDSFLRVFVVILTSAVSTLLYKLLETLGLLGSSDVSVLAFLFYCNLSLWPISILFGGGRVGIHDLVAKTEVVRSNQHEEALVISPNRQLLLTAVTVTIVALLGAWPLRVLVGYMGETAQQQETNRGSAELRTRLNVGGQKLVRKIGNGGLYFNGRVVGTAGPWTPADARTFRHSVSASTFPQDLLEGVHRFQQLVRFEVEMHPAGFTSAEFHAALAQELADRTDRDPGTMIIYEFYLRRRLPLVEITVSKSLVGVFERSAGNKPHLYLLEPDMGNGIQLTLYGISS